MKFIPFEGRPDDPWPQYGLHRLELTERNLRTLLAKLDDPLSVRTLIDPDTKIAVMAIRSDEQPEPLDKDSAQYKQLVGIEVVAVPDDEHYASQNRQPGEVFMPSTGEYR